MYHILYELCSGGDVKEFLDKAGNSFSFSRAVRMATEVCVALFGPSRKCARPRCCRA